MSETSLVLFIDLEPGRKVDLRTAARAAIAWADMVEEIGAHFSPMSPPSIKLESAQPGSQKLKAVLASISDDPKTTIRTAIVSALTFITLTTASWTWEQVLEWMKGDDAPEEARTLSEADLENLARDVADALEERMAEGSARRIYDELGADPNVTGAGISSQTDSRPQNVVARRDFPPQIFILEEEGVEKRSRTEIVDLVLLKPILTKETNKRWGFSWPHGKIGATIKDETFLNQLSAGQLGITMSEGIVFRVVLQIMEERRGSTWTVKEYSILRVIDVQPPYLQDNLALE